MNTHEMRERRTNHKTRGTQASTSDAASGFRRVKGPEREGQATANSISAAKTFSRGWAACATRAYARIIDEQGDNAFPRGWGSCARKGRRQRRHARRVSFARMGVLHEIGTRHRHGRSSAFSRDEGSDEEGNCQQTGREGKYLVTQMRLHVRAPRSISPACM